MTPIDKIRQAAEISDSTHLDAPVYTTQDTGINRLICDRDDAIQSYFDVPARAIATLGRRDFFEQGKSWREISYSIHGENWDNEVFAYFDSELYDTNFPAPSSRYGLRLFCLGGACAVINGNHRAVAAKLWLIARDGSSGTLKKAKLTAYTLSNDLRKLLTEAVANNIRLETGLLRHHKTGTSVLIRATGPAFERLYRVDSMSNALNQIHHIGRLGRLLRRPIPDAFRAGGEWLPLPKSICEQMLDDTWLLDQIAANLSLRRTDSDV